MDINSLVQQITNEVIKKMGNTISQSSPNYASNMQTNTNINLGPSILVILNSNQKNINEIYAELKKLKDRFKVSILLSRTASRVLTKANVISNTGINSVYEDTGSKIDELFNYDAIILPNLTIATLSKLANMINDCNLTDIVIYYLVSKKPVYIGLDFLRYLVSINPPATSAIQDYILKLKKMGALEIKISDISGIVPGRTTDTGEAFIVSGLDLKNLADAGATRIGTSFGLKVDLPSEVANLIDHTLLKPEVTRDQIIKLCEEAKKYNFASVCVNPGWVKTCSELLKGTEVKVCTVIGFPLGATTTATKAAETREAIANGADEIDMVINIGALKAGENELVYQDIKGVVDAAQGRVVKVIIETALLTDEEKIRACKLSKQAGAHYVKTSTGFASGGATLADIALMRAVVGPDIGVKASGGVRDFNQVKNLLEVGATRVGASASIAIISGGKGTGAY